MKEKWKKSQKALSLSKPLSVTTNVVGLQTDDAGHVCQNSSAHVAHVVNLRTDAVVVTETQLRRVYCGEIHALLSFKIKRGLRSIYKIYIISTIGVQFKLSFIKRKPCASPKI